MQKSREFINEEKKERAEYAEALQNLRAVLATNTGRNFIKYLFTVFDVGELPEIGIPDDFLRDRLGFLRAGNSVYKLVAAANPEIAGMILGTIEKEKYVQANYDETGNG